MVFNACAHERVRKAGNFLIRVQNQESYVGIGSFFWRSCDTARVCKCVYIWVSDFGFEILSSERRGNVTWIYEHADGVALELLRLL